jgi:hypothetical protein
MYWTARGLHADYAVALAQQTGDRHAGPDLGTKPARRTNESGGDQVGVGKTCLRFEADGVDAIQPQPGVLGVRLGPVEHGAVDAHPLLHFDAAPHGVGRGSRRGDDEVARADQASVGIRIVEQVRELLEHAKAGTGDRDVGSHRVVSAHDS